MTKEEDLLKFIDDLKKQVDIKDKENEKYIDKIEYLEEEIMKLNELMSERPSKNKNKKIKESKLQVELDIKDREIRELKNKMGFLRKDKLDAQKKLENIKTLEKSSSIIRVEELREKAPLNMLVKELQNKINKQDSIIRKIKNQKGDNYDISEELQEKEELIESLKLELLELRENFKSKTKIDTNIKIQENLPESKNNLTKELIKELQNNLNKYKRQNEDLRKKIDSYKNKDKFDKKVEEYESTIAQLTAQLNDKASSLRAEGSITDNTSVPSTLKQVVEELKDKLNKSKIQISILQNQLNTQSNQKTSQIDIDDKLKIQREMASFLQQQLDETKKALAIKDQEIATIKNEAILIKTSHEELKNQLRLKDKKISTLMNDLNRLSVATQNQSQTPQAENPQLLLRIEELRTIIEDLTKQNKELRLEIDQLRKSI
ncbi:MAG: hypothetical protein ACFFBY_03060 [Promethearchaeota archaeon]